MSTTLSPAQSARTELSAFSGELIGPDDTDYDGARALFNAMIDKRPALDCPLRRPRGHRRRHPLRTHARAPARGPRRRPQRRRPRQRRRRRCLRPLPVEGHRCRSRHADRPRRWWLSLERGRRCDAASRPDGPWRDHLHHRRRRSHARRRAWLPQPTLRADDRQPALGRDGARRRAAGDSQRRRESGPLLGDPRRRRELRRRDRVHLPGATGRHRGRRPDLLGTRGRGRAARRLPRVAALCAAQRDGVLQLPHHPAGASVPGGDPPAQGLRHRVVHRRHRRGGGAGDGAAARRSQSR